MILSRTFFNFSFYADRDVTQPEKPPKTSWPLMGDINTHRAGIPEHLIQWRRAKSEDDLPGS